MSGGNSRWYMSTRVRAGADISTLQNKLVNAAGTIATSAATVLGILQNKPNASGKDAEVGYIGEMKCVAGGAILAGSQLTPTASGTVQAITQVASAGPFITPCGRALEAANSGDIFTGIFNFANAATIAVA
jgi:hypothetical protein